MADTTVTNAAKAPQASSNSDPKSPALFTLSDAERVIGSIELAWDKRAPSPAEWVVMGGRLANVHKAVGAMTGMLQLLKQHKFGMLAERDGDGETKYVGITEYQAGCIEEGVEIIAWTALHGLEEASEILGGGA